MLYKRFIARLITQSLIYVCRKNLLEICVCIIGLGVMLDFADVFALPCTL